MEPRRLKQIVVQRECLAQLIAFPSPPGEWIRLDGGIPCDAKCVGLYIDYATESVVMTFEHESFPVVPIGGHVPYTASANVTCLYGPALVEMFASGRMTLASLAEDLKVNVDQPHIAKVVTNDS